MGICYTDGIFQPSSEASLPLSDFAFQRGVAVFETIRTYGGRPMALSPHLERLTASAAASRIAIPASIEEIKGIIKEGIGLVGGEVTIRPYITGGDILDRECGFTRSRLFILFEPLVPFPEENYREGVYLYPDNSSRPMAGIKSVNYLGSYLPLAEDHEAVEVLYCPGGEITESSHSNAFMLLGGRILTAPEDRVLPGTMRGMVLEIAREEGFLVEERCPLISELPQCEEFFITGSVKEILPVVRVGGTTIGCGRPGPVSSLLRRLYRQDLKRWLE